MKSHNNSNLNFLVPVLILLAAFITAQFIFIIRTEQFKDWISTPAVVLQEEDLIDFKIRIYYSYTVNGKSYSGSDIYEKSNRNHAEIGSEITIWYAPDDASKSSFYKPNPSFDSYAPYFLAVPLSIGLILRNYRKK